MDSIKAMGDGDGDGDGECYLLQGRGGKKQSSWGMYRNYIVIGD